MLPMPLYHYDIAAERDEPYPPVSELRTVEAPGPLEAFEKLRGKLVLGEPGQTQAWLRVVVAHHADGSVRQALTPKVPLVQALFN